MKFLLFALIVAFGFEITAMADLKPSALLNCTVTKVTPEKATFFQFKEGPVVGDTVTQDFAASEIQGLTFSSGAVIGHTVVPHPLLKKPAFDGVSLHEVRFTSQHNRNDYIARLQALDDPKDANRATVSLDVVEIPHFPDERISIHSLEMACKR